MTSGEGVLVLGRGHIRHYYSKYALSSSISIYSTLIVIVLWDYTAVFLCHRWILFILLWDWWYANMSPLTKNQCRDSDTQVSVNACMPFLHKMCVVTSPWWIDRWCYTERDDSGGYIISTSESLLYGHDKQAMVLFFITLIYHVVIISWRSVYIWMNILNIII